MQRPIPLRLASLALAGALLIGTRAVAADAENGERLARRWCAACHLVTPDQTSAADGVPSFAAVGRGRDWTPESLAAFLAAPHPPMPDMALSRGEIGDLVAYIRQSGRR